MSSGHAPQVLVRRQAGLYEFPVHHLFHVDGQRKACNDGKLHNPGHSGNNYMIEFCFYFSRTSKSCKLVCSGAVLIGLVALPNKEYSTRKEECKLLQ